jgi:hypothetical protein
MSKEKKFREKHPNSDFAPPDDIYFKNKITRIPKNIIDLKKLEIILISCEAYQNCLKELISLMPNTVIIYRGKDISSIVK